MLLTVIKSNFFTPSEYKNRYKTGDKKAVIELLERYPWFISESWVVKALKEKPVKSGKKWGDTKISRTLITALVNALKKKGCSKDRAFRILSGRIGIGYGRIRDLYYDTEKSLINKPFAVPSIPEPSILKSIDEYNSMDVEQYISKRIKGSMSECYGIYNPEYLWERAIKRYGNEGAKRVMSAYIEDAKELLNKDAGNGIIRGAKKILIENAYIEKAQSLMAQMG